MRMIRPMGAVTPNREKLEIAYKSDEWHAEPKMDGSRYIAQIIDGKVFLTSRRESVKGGMVYHTDCGHDWVFSRDTFESSDFETCPFKGCGKKIEVSDD